MPRPPRQRVPDRPYAAYLFDLDGTIYLGDQLLPGARRLIEALRERGLPVRFLSNNPTRTLSSTRPSWAGWACRPRSARSSTPS